MKIISMTHYVSSCFKLLFLIIYHLKKKKKGYPSHKGLSSGITKF